jgi:hypothetical protein
MGLILGMDSGVFAAWIGTILATVLCILYGMYHYYVYVKKSNESDDEKSYSRKTKGSQKKEEE